MKYPLLPFFCAYAAGVILQVYAPLPLGGWGLFLVGALPLLFLLRSKAAAQWCFLFIAAAAITGWHTTYFPADDLRNLLNSEPKLASVRGVITFAPEERAYQYQHEFVIRTTSRVRITEVRTNEVWVKASGTILVNNKGIIPEHFFKNQNVELDGIIKPPPSAPAPNMFDFRKYLKWQGIHYQFETESEKSWKVFGETKVIEPRPEQFRKWAYDVIGRGLDENSESTQLLRAMALGWRANLAGEISTPFMRTGTMHVFAISGLHITSIAWLLMVLGRHGFRLTTRQTSLIVIPLLWFYTMATGFQASAVRSSIMSTVFILAYLVERPNSFINSWAASALMILLYDPLQLFQASFQLSFSVVLVILLLVEWTDKAKEKLQAQIVDPYLPQELVTTWHRRRIALLRTCILPVVVTTGAWLGSLPLVLHYFNLVTPSSLLANLIIVPLTNVALAASIFNLLLGHLFMPISKFCNTIAWWMMELSTQVATQVANWPFSYFYFQKPTAIFFILFYTLVFAWLVHFTLRIRQIITGGAVTLLALQFGLTHYHNSTTTLVAILPVQGSPVFVDQAGKTDDLLIDCSRLNEARTFLPRYFHAQGISSIRNVLLTHGDIAHAEGFPLLEKEFAFQRVFTSPAPPRSTPYKNILSSISPGKLQTNAHSGVRISAFQVLHPPPGAKGGRADDQVVVLFGEINGTKLLLLGDSSEKGQLDLIAANPELKADVVIVSMPAQGEPLHPSLLEQIAPRIIIVGSTEFPVPARASSKLRLRLALSKIPVFYTEDHGGLHLEFKYSSLKIISAQSELTTLSSRK